MKKFNSETVLLISLAMREMNAKKPSAAIELLKQAAEISPFEPDIYDLLGWCFIVSGQNEAGEEFFTAKMAEKIWPCFLIARAGCRMRLKKYPEALADVEKFLELKPRSGVIVALYYRLKISLDSGDQNAAVENAREIISLSLDSEPCKQVQRRAKEILAILERRNERTEQSAFLN
ncbi:MAG: hypothetical protein PHW33_03240 [Candidatus Portnoybacteria bacterium]|jgi:tetratricopeptide (TPR) repeat protein|nr:hypothetical protein [Candidatus Portnoybacteria bacterium]